MSSRPTLLQVGKKNWRADQHRCPRGHPSLFSLSFLLLSWTGWTDSTERRTFLRPTYSEMLDKVGRLDNSVAPPSLGNARGLQRRWCSDSYNSAEFLTRNRDMGSAQFFLEIAGYSNGSRVWRPPLFYPVTLHNTTIA